MVRLDQEITLLIKHGLGKWKEINLHNVKNANGSIQSCIKKILEDTEFSVKIDYVDWFWLKTVGPQLTIKGEDPQKCCPCLRDGPSDSNALFGLSKLSVWWLRLGIEN